MVVTEDCRLRIRMEAKVNGMEWWVDSVQFAVRLRSDVMKRSAGDEGFHCF